MLASCIMSLFNIIIFSIFDNLPKPRLLNNDSLLFSASIAYCLPTSKLIPGLNSRNAFKQALSLCAGNSHSALNPLRALLAALNNAGYAKEMIGCAGCLERIRWSHRSQWQ